MLFSFLSAPARLDAARPILKRGAWGDGVSAVCLMSALVPGARSTSDCVTAGWPLWLADACISCFDGVDDAAALEFAAGLADAVSRPFDADAARDRFMITALGIAEPHDRSGSCTTVAALLRRRLAGEDVAAELRAASAYAYASADALASAASARAASAARAAAASNAAASARAAAAAAALAADADVAADVAAGDAAGAAAWTRLGAGLVAAIRESRTA